MQILIEMLKAASRDAPANEWEFDFDGVIVIKKQKIRTREILGADLSLHNILFPEVTDSCHSRPCVGSDDGGELAASDRKLRIK